MIPTPFMTPPPHFLEVRPLTPSHLTRSQTLRPNRVQLHHLLVLHDIVALRNSEHSCLARWTGFPSTRSTHIPTQTKRTLSPPPR